MSKKTDQQYEEILGILDAHPAGLHRGEISDLLKFSINDKTLQLDYAFISRKSSCMLA